jgi:phosphatidate phosphatase APP1
MNNVNNQAEAALNAAKAKTKNRLGAAFAYLKANSAKIVAITAIAVVVTTVMASYIRGQDALVSTFSAGLVQQEKLERKIEVERLERKIQSLATPLTVPAEYRHNNRGLISAVRDVLGLTKVAVTVTPGAGVTATTDDGRSYVAQEGAFVQVR